MRQILDSVAILDLDGEGMIIDPSAREEKARKIVLAKLAGKEVPSEDSNEYKKLFFGRDAFFSEDLLHLDKLNSGAIQAIERLRTIYTDIYILTSRPDFLARDTMLWLKEHGIELADDEIRFKLYADGEDKREQFTGTPAWKSTIVYERARIYRSVLFVDNEEKNRRAIEALKMPNVTIRGSLNDYIFDDKTIII